MRKSIKYILLLLVIIIATLWTLDAFRLLERYKLPVNQSFNALRKVNTACRKDTQCTMAPVDCSPCREVGGAVNQSYRTWCPLNYKDTKVFCSGTQLQWREFTAVCQEGQCVAVHPEKKN
ncbi:MAG: hypothetical protein AAB932_03885 [Patescibacteria group bacterium]